MTAEFVQEQAGAMARPLQQTIVTLNAGLELRTFCLITIRMIKARRADSAQFQAPKVFVSTSDEAILAMPTTNETDNLYPGSELFDLANPKEAQRLFNSHPLVATALLQSLPELQGPLETAEIIWIRTGSQVPRGSGLGGSSSLLVALLSAFEKLHETNAEPSQTRANCEDSLKQLCQLACGLEAGLLGGLAGIQDHLGAAFGGLATYELLPSGNITRKALPAEAIPWLEQHGLLLHSGGEHHSGNTNGQILRGFFEGKNDSVHLFRELAVNAASTAQALARGDHTSFSQGAGRDWTLRRNAFALLTTPRIEELMHQATASGATSAKVCGAAAGGVILVLFDGTPSTKNRLIEGFAALGASTLPLRIAQSGVTVTDLP
jgi:D-glycero-alpha-D-manno-heptose-7-phosphate kinase